MNTAKIAENPAVKAFVDYYLSDNGLVTGVGEAGYVQLPADRVEATRSAWERRCRVGADRGRRGRIAVEAPGPSHGPRALAKVREPS